MPPSNLYCDHGDGTCTSGAVCGVVEDASVPEPAAATPACPNGQFLLVPCCGGYNDTSCSNGSPPPAPFCITLPDSCAAESSCLVGGCEGPLDQAQRTLGCTCI